MTSARKIAANRRNASHSTGPRSAEGKMSSRRNAFKHGLAMPMVRDPAEQAEIERLTTALVGVAGDATHLAVARAAAVAELEFRRACDYRVQVINTEIAMVEGENAGNAPSVDKAPPEVAAMMRRLDDLKRLERYLRRSFSHRNQLLRELVKCKGEPAE
jgi:hypothetical protein